MFISFLFSFILLTLTLFPWTQTISDYTCCTCIVCIVYFITV